MGRPRIVGTSIEEQREYKREYMRKWCAEHKEYLSEYRKRRRLEHPEKFKEYYETHKDKIYESNTKWRKSHSKQFTKLVSEARKRKVEKLRSQGCTNAWCVVNRGDEPKFKKVGEYHAQ